jgi:ADP-heptose:LPS heptosyltransferase
MTNLMIPKIRKVRMVRNNIPIRDFYNKRNKVLLIRDGGGVGDILMLRMIIEDFKMLMPEAEIHVATPINYHLMLKDHPYIDKQVNSRELDENEYFISYNITNICTRYELSIAPRADMHRSDIWASHCGVQLTRHNMHLQNSDELKQFAKKCFNKLGIRNPCVAFCPFTSQSSKDLDQNQIDAVIAGVREMELDIFIIHNKDVLNVDCPVITGTSFKQWLAIVEASDYIISADTGTFHAAQGFNKPTVGVFGWADGKVYGKYHTKLELVQRHRDHTPGWSCGPCYNWTKCSLCPDHNISRKPCITEITGNEICVALKKLIQRYPVENIPQPF